jgi:nucleotide-binding universal stress UspA family protein
MKILIPLDGSDGSLRAVDYVISQLDTFKALPQLLLLNVQWKVATANVKLFINHDVIDDYYREQGLAALQSARAVLDEAQLPYQYHVSVGDPAAAIVQYAREQAVDQIVMCRQGAGGLQSLLLGYEVGKVLHLADCPVLLVK